MGSTVGGEAAGDLIHATLECAQIGLWEMDLDTRRAWRSPAHAAIFGYSPGETEPWCFDDFRNHIHPEDRSRVDRLVDEGSREGPGWSFECRILRKDEALRWITVRAIAIPGVSAPCRRMRGIVMDITDRKLAEIEATENERRFTSLANSAPVLIWTSGVDKLCDFFNEPWLAFTGRSMTQELGNGWTEGVHPEDFDRCLRTYVSHFEARLPFRMEYRLRRHDGAYRWLLDHGVPRHLPDGTFAGYIGSCIDVTDQKLDREAALESARSAQHLQSVLEQLTAQQQTILYTSPLGIGMVRNRRIVWSNPAHWALFGYNEDETRGMPTQAFYEQESDYRQQGVDAYEALRRGGTHTAEVRLKKKDGKGFWCQIIGKAVDPTDPESGSIWLLKNVDEIRRVEARFRLQSETLAHMGEGVVLVSGRDGTILETNRMFDRMLGYAQGELLGRPIAIVNAPGELSPDEVAARILDELHRNGSWEGDITNQRKDGTSLICHVTISYFHHPELGEVWISVHTDVTRAKELERSLREANERYDDLVRHIPSGVHQVRLLNNGTFRFDFVSPRTAQLVGVELEELYRDATLWTRHAWPEDAARAAEEIRRCIATKEPFEWEGRFQVDGTTRWLRFDGRPASQSNGEVVWNAVVNDITEPKALEASHREDQKRTAIAHLAGGMAHEFNNILAAMLMNIGLAQDDDTPASVVELLDDLEKSCIQAGGLIKQLLAFGQKSVLSPQPIELNQFLAHQMPLLQRALGTRVRVEWGGSTHPIWVTGDVALLVQALRNLCENAGDAMKSDGLVRISLEVQNIGARGPTMHREARTGCFACLAVEDRGCGMDSKTLGRLFEPFFSTKEVGQGTGLGLATVQGIIRQHRGWVEVESELGRGSCFRIYLPVADATEHPSRAGHSEFSAAVGAATILMAEDDEGLRTAATLLLNRAGYRVLVAHDAGVAQKLWEEHGDRVDLLFTDVVMPGAESGLQLARRLLKQRPSLKVILTSGYSSAVEEVPAEHAGSLIYLAKPVPSEVLLQTIQQCLGPSPVRQGEHP